MKSPGSRKYTDIRNDFNGHPNTKDLIKLTDEASIKQSVTNLVMLQPEEKPFHPEITSGVHQYLFEPMNDVTGKLIEKSIETVINDYEPRVSLVGVVAEPDEDKNAYQIVIIYQINNSPHPVSIQELDFYMERLR